MGSVQVYLAKGAQSNPANQGRLVQTCTVSCLSVPSMQITNNLIGFYMFKDSIPYPSTCMKTHFFSCFVKLIQAIQMDYHGHWNHCLPLLLPPQHKTCKSLKQRTRTQGKGAFIDRRWKSCCVKAGAEIWRRGGSRSACITHAPAEIIGTTIPPPAH